MGMQRILAAGIAGGLLSRLDSDAPEMVLAAATALVTLNALAHLRSAGAREGAAGGGEAEVQGMWFWRQAKGHSNLRFMGETVLQLLNRSDSIGEQRRLLIMTLDLLEEGEGGVIYANDIRVLADMCIRGLADEGFDPGGQDGEGSRDKRICDQSRTLRVRVLEQLLLRPEFVADREACQTSAEVLIKLMDCPDAYPQAAREAERVLNAHISVLDPPH